MKHVLDERDLECVVAGKDRITRSLDLLDEASRAHTSAMATLERKGGQVMDRAGELLGGKP